jgi:hypothetical protein
MGVFNPNHKLELWMKPGIRTLLLFSLMMMAFSGCAPAPARGPDTLFVDAGKATVGATKAATGRTVTLVMKTLNHGGGLRIGPLEN